MLATCQGRLYMQSVAEKVDCVTSSGSNIWRPCATIACSTHSVHSYIAIVIAKHLGLRIIPNTRKLKHKVQMLTIFLVVKIIIFAHS